jgi:hypothetical protein
MRLIFGCPSVRRWILVAGYWMLVPGLTLTPRVKLRQNGTVFLMIKLADSVAGLNSEPQNIEYRMSNFEGWKRCALSF